MDLQVAIQTQLQNGDQSVYLLDTGPTKRDRWRRLGISMVEAQQSAVDAKWTWPHRGDG